MVKEIYESIKYIPTFEGIILNIIELEDLKSFIHSESFNRLILKLVSRMLKLRSFDKLNIIKLFESCELLNIDKINIGIYPTYKILFTSFLMRVEKLVIDIKLKNNTIKNYDDIKYIQNVISNIDKYYSFRGLVNFNTIQDLEDEIRKKLFKESLKDFIEYLCIIKKEI